MASLAEILAGQTKKQAPTASWQYVGANNTSPPKAPTASWQYVGANNTTASAKSTTASTSTTPVSTEETPAQANARILESLGLDTVLTPKRKKQPAVGLNQPELVNTLGG